VSSPLPELRATYRLQLTPGFGFQHARGLIPYLRDLGVSHLYLSPSLQARPGSTHGYDVIDPGRLSDSLGGEAGFRALAEEARGAGLGIVLDVVPNHMAADPGDRFWADEELRGRFFDIDPVSGRHRRFFDIDELAAIRQEDPEVFEATHEFVLNLVRDELIDGLRVDHPDGLADPAAYLARLREGGVERVWVEKILDPNEKLRDWPVCGTVGYEFLNDVAALFVDPAGEAALTALWQRVSGDARPFTEVAFEAKVEQARGTFAPEVERLLRVLDSTNARISLPGAGGEMRDLVEALASLPVYRTYVDPVTRSVAPEDRAAIEASGMDPTLAAMLLLEADAPPEFVTRFQQTTPAIMAKGVEDTAFYRYGRLLTLNDVGGDPSRFGIDVERFHAGNSERAERFPLGLLTTMTHDAKRSADVRARIGVLASVADEWTSTVERWFELAAPHRTAGSGPDDAEAYFIFQTLVGSWPIEPERIDGYIVKALREAKRNTNWVDQNVEWEQAVQRFAAALLADRLFMAKLESFVARIAPAGERAALGQATLKLTAPGVPDIYQGDELPLRALVDPDNRRPVDWRLNEALLRRLMGGGRPGSDTLKLYVTHALLKLRDRRPELFAEASYEPLRTGDGACAFLRGDRLMTVVAVRDPSDSALVGAPSGRWREVLTGIERSFGARVPLTSVLTEFGVAVFERI
jgi:(1->4)-alpha-D-glucan 1-alpha-D-glucosylmutase